MSKTQTLTTRSFAGRWGLSGGWEGLGLPSRGGLSSTLAKILAVHLLFPDMSLPFFTLLIQILTIFEDQHSPLLLQEAPSDCS